MSEHVKTLTPEKAAKILADNGLPVNQEQAEKITEFMSLLAKITFTNEKSKSKDVDSISSPI